MAILETCNGIIRDGLCTKCYSRQNSTSIRCNKVYEIEPPKAGDQPDTGLKKKVVDYINEKHGHGASSLSGGEEIFDEVVTAAEKYAREQNGGSSGSGIIQESFIAGCKFMFERLKKLN